MPHVAKIYVHGCEFITKVTLYLHAHVCVCVCVYMYVYMYIYISQFQLISSTKTLFLTCCFSTFSLSRIKFLKLILFAQHLTYDFYYPLHRSTMFYAFSYVAVKHFFIS